MSRLMSLLGRIWKREPVSNEMSQTHIHQWGMCRDWRGREFYGCGVCFVDVDGRKRRMKA